MRIELKIPEVGESVREVQIGHWLKQEGDTVQQDESLVELETDKASMDLPAPTAGVIDRILKREGELVAVGEVIGYIENDGMPSHDNTEPTQVGTVEASRQVSRPQVGEPLPSRVAGEPTHSPLRTGSAVEEQFRQRVEEIPVTPSARRALREHGLAASDIEAKGSRIDRDDVLRHVEDLGAQPRTSESDQYDPVVTNPKAEVQQATGELEEMVPMSLIRRRIAERLVHAQQQAALLTTFNEIDMTAVNELRATYRKPFEQKYGVKLGFMSFFIKAAVDGLKEQPDLNAEIRGTQIMYRHYYHIGIAISSAKGLVVPVLRFSERLSFAEIEQAIDDFVRRANDKKLLPQELEGGTFTITNGGIFGSLFSTPIVNPPQSSVLGMHAIQDRPVAYAGQVVIRPMMYIALTYDHRLVDGREAVTFLKRIKDAIEDPSRMLLEV